MAQPVDPIDITLAELRQTLGDTLTMVNIAIALRRNSGHLLSLLRGMMVDLGEHIDHALPTFPDPDKEDGR